MPHSKFNGVLKEIVEQGSKGDVAGLLQERLQIPMDKAEELAKRIQKEGNFQGTSADTQNDKTVEGTNPNPEATSYSVESLSEREFERFMKWLLDELGFEIQLDPPAGVGATFLATKEGKKISIYIRKCPINLRISNSAVVEANEAKQTDGCSKSIVAATAFFSRQAILDAQKLSVELWDRNMIVQKIEELRNNFEVEEQSCFPPFKGSLLKSLLGLEDTKDFIIEPKVNGKYDLHLPGIRYPLLTFQALGEEVVRCVFRIKYNEPVGEFDGEVLIGLDSANVRFGPDGLQAYAAIVLYLDQFVE